MPRSILEWMLKASDKKDEPISRHPSKKQKLSPQEKDKLEYRLWELAEEYEREDDN